MIEFKRARPQGRRWLMVQGTIDRQGRAMTIRVVQSDARDARGRPTSADALVQTVMENLRTWRLEPASREDAFRITFAFEVTDDLSQFSLEFRLPKKSLKNE